MITRKERLPHGFLSFSASVLGVGSGARNVLYGVETVQASGSYTFPSDIVANNALIYYVMGNHNFKSALYVFETGGILHKIYGTTDVEELQLDSNNRPKYTNAKTTVAHMRYFVVNIQ